MLRLPALFVLVIIVGLMPASATGVCHAARGMHVTLFGGVDDPDVLVWDSRDRLVTYAGGSSDERSFLLPHALLTRPGTSAVVQECLYGIVHPKFRMDPADAVGVLIMTGRYRGRYGWVSSGDVHGPGIPEDRERW
jgi:hypothetical protein